MKEAQAKLARQMRRYEEKYPAVTDAQQKIADLDFHELQEKLQEGNLTAVQVLEAFQAKAVAVNRETNAVTEFLEDATVRAKGLDALPKDARGPLHGLPISLKVCQHSSSCI